MTRAKRNNGKPIGKIVRRVFGILGIFLTIFVAALLLAVVVQLFSGKDPSLFGYRFYYILTDSMSPTYDAGDVVLSKTFPSEDSKFEIKVGDVVTFLGNTGSQSGKIITHRVVKAPYFDEAEGRYFVVTRGDKEFAPDDPPIPVANVEAKCVGESFVVGFLFRAIRTPAGYVLIVVVPVCVVIAILILKLISEYRKKKEKTLQEAEQKRVETLKEEAVKAYLRSKETEADGKNDASKSDPPWENDASKTESPWENDASETESLRNNDDPSQTDPPNREP